MRDKGDFERLTKKDHAPHPDRPPEILLAAFQPARLPDLLFVVDAP
jgi:hypothetical protein